MSGEPGLTDEQIRTMTPAERRDLIRRLCRPAPEPRPRGGLLRGRSRVVLLAGAVIVMLPWIAYLAVVLPNRYDARHWDLTWAGFDLLLAAMLAATVVFAIEMIATSAHTLTRLHRTVNPYDVEQTRYFRTTFLAP